MILCHLNIERHLFSSVIFVLTNLKLLSLFATNDRVTHTSLITKMKSLKYELIKKPSGCTYLYLIDDKQLFTVKSIQKKSIIYRCRNRACNNTLQVKNDICIRKQHTNHHEDDDGENGYFELKMEVIVRQKLVENLYNKKSITEILSENNIPSTLNWQHRLYRLKKKLIKENTTKIIKTKITKPVNKHVLVDKPQNSIAINILNDPTNKNESEHSKSTNEILQEALNTLKQNPIYEIEQNLEENFLIYDNTHNNHTDCLKETNPNATNSENIESNESLVIEQNTLVSVKNSSQNQQNIEIEAIFIQNHKIIDNMELIEKSIINSENPLRPENLINFSIKEIACLNHLASWKPKCSECETNRGKIALFPCFDTLCQTCWTQLNAEHEIDKKNLFHFHSKYSKQ